jgi:hypothetical protein
VSPTTVTPAATTTPSTTAVPSTPTAAAPAYLHGVASCSGLDRSKIGWHRRSLGRRGRRDDHSDPGEHPFHNAHDILLPN